MSVKIAHSTWCCKNIDDALAVIEKEKYLEWDLNTLPFSLNAQRMSYVRSFIRDNGEVRFHLPHSFWDIGASDASIADNSLDYYGRLFETIRYLNAQYAVMHLGVFDGADEDIALENLVILANRANNCGIKLCVENLIHGLSSNMNFIGKCLSVPHVYMCFDTGHAEILRRQEGNTVVENIVSVKEKIIHAHVYDCEDDSLNHIPFTQQSITTNVWLPLLQTTGCLWYTMEVDLREEQDEQKKLMEQYLHNKKQLSK